MLYETAFKTSHALTYTVNKLVKNATTNLKVPFIKIGLHIRHNKEEDDGNDIRLPLNCVERVLISHSTHNKACVLLLITDRLASVISIQNFLKGKCTVVHQNHMVQKSWSSEHGLWAAAGVIDQELVMYADVFLYSKGTYGKLAAARAKVREALVYDYAQCSIDPMN